MTHVFVYGTLRHGSDNDIIRLHRAGTRAGRRRTGTWHALRPGRAYPGLVLGGANTVRGEVYASTPALEQRLDEIECLYSARTAEYFKRAIEIQVDVPDGGARRVTCICYEDNPAYLRGAPIITGGDWM